MKYQALDLDTNKVLAEAPTKFELGEILEYECITDYNLVQIPECRNCGNEGRERHDHYRISTGVYCDKCYETNYPYRKDAYDPYNDYGTRDDWY